MLSRSLAAALPHVVLALWLPLAVHSAEEETASRRIGSDLFQSGSNVRFAEQIPGDALMAGGEIDFAGAAGGDVALAGGRVRVDGNIGEDLYAAGGNLRLGGRIAGDARIAGGDIDISREAYFGEGLTVAGGRIEFEGHAAEYAQLAGGNIRLNGRVDGDVEAAGGNLIVGPNAVIQGRLTYRGPQDAQVSPQAQIQGGIENVRDERMGGSERGWRVFLGIVWAAWLIGLLIVGIVLLTLLPASTRAITGTIRTRPGAAVLLGFVLLIVVPVAIMLASITLVGIPLALLLLLAYLALLPLGYLASVATLGDWLLPRLRRGERPVTRGWRIGAFALALLIILLVTRVPFIGGIISFALLLFGMGGIVLAATRNRGSTAPMATSPAETPHV